MCSLPLPPVFLLGMQRTCRNSQRAGKDEMEDEKGSEEDVHARSQHALQEISMDFKIHLPSQAALLARCNYIGGIAQSEPNEHTFYGGETA